MKTACCVQREPSGLWEFVSLLKSGQPGKLSCSDQHHEWGAAEHRGGGGRGTGSRLCCTIYCFLCAPGAESGAGGGAEEGGAGEEAGGGQPGRGRLPGQRGGQADVDNTRPAGAAQVEYAHCKYLHYTVLGECMTGYQIYNGWEQITENPLYGRECFNIEPIQDHR